MSLLVNLVGRHARDALQSRCGRLQPRLARRQRQLEVWRAGYQEGVLRVSLRLLCRVIIISKSKVYKLVSILICFWSLVDRNWLRDYSQAMDIGTLKKLQPQVRLCFSAYCLWNALGI